jgi:hypothetical protein
MRTTRLPHIIFWIFSVVVFSKIAWYDLRVYLPPEVRREFMTACFAVWVFAHGAVYLPVALPMLRQFNRVALAWVVAVIPYFAMGILEGRVNVFLLGDLARYSLALGYLLFGLWAVRNVSARTILIAMASSLATWMVVRTVLHLVFAKGTIRYGLHWEVMLVCILIAFAGVAEGRRFGVVLVSLAGTLAGTIAGQTRAVLLGTAIAGSVIGAWTVTAARSRWPSSFRMGAAAGFAVALAVAPMILPAPAFRRINLTQIGADTDTKRLAEIAADGAAAAAGEDAAAQEGPSQARSFRSIDLDDARLRVALDRWEEAIADGGLSMDVRVAEASYFIALMSRDNKSRLLGAGGGEFVTVTVPEGERIVRGAHNTYVTLLFRHGVIFGTFLALLVSFYGLPTLIGRLATAPLAEWYVLLIALVSYRLAAVAMAQFHQGLFDDPIVFLSMAIASNLRSSSVGAGPEPDRLPTTNAAQVGPTGSSSSVR